QARLPVDDFGTLELGEPAKHGAREDVATRGGLVPHDSVVKQEVAGAPMLAQEHVLLGPGGTGGAGFGEPDMGCQVLELDAFAHLPALVKDGRAELHEAKSPAPLPFDVFGDAALFSVHHG